MAHVLLCYATGEGQTAKVADSIAEVLEARGHETTTVNVRDVGDELDLGAVDAVLVGASIHRGRHQKAIRKWVQTNRDDLVGKPTGFFQVSLSSADATDEATAAEAAGYVDEFIEATGWRPDRIGLFGGALRFSQYGFFLGALMKRIGRDVYSKGRIEESGDVEFTDWTEVEAFATAFGTFVEDRIREPLDAT